MKISIGHTKPCKIRRDILNEFSHKIMTAIDESIIRKREIGFIFVKDDKGDLLATPIEIGRRRSIRQPTYIDKDYIINQGGQLPHKIVGDFHSHGTVRDFKYMHISTQDLLSLIDGRKKFIAVGGLSNRSKRYGMRVVTKPNDNQIIKIHKRAVHNSYLYGEKTEDKNELLDMEPKEIKDLLRGRLDTVPNIPILNDDDFRDLYYSRIKESLGYAGNRCRKIVFGKRKGRTFSLRFNY